MMPSYEFICSICNVSKAVQFKMDEEKVPPRCCGEFMDRVWSPTAVVFKGSGWASKS